VSRCGRIGIGSRAEARPVRASRSEAQKALRKRSSGSVLAATGLRPSELFGLEQHDGDRQAGVVYVRRAFANGRIKNTKTRLSTRAVPLQAKALHALDGLPASVNPILFLNARSGRIDFRIFGRRLSRLARSQRASRRFAVCTTCATLTRPSRCGAGVPVFAVSRFIGSIAMIDRHYGRLARDSREHAVALLDALALERAKGADQQQL